MMSQICDRSMLILDFYQKYKICINRKIDNEEKRKGIRARIYSLGFISKKIS